MKNDNSSRNGKMFQLFYDNDNMDSAKKMFKKQKSDSHPDSNKKGENVIRKSLDRNNENKTIDSNNNTNKIIDNFDIVRTKIKIFKNEV